MRPRAANSLLPTYLLTCFAILFCLVNGIGSMPLFDQDEAAYAGFARTMLETGDWITPEYPWCDAHRKTPLHFWLIACAYSLFGYSEWVTRLPAILSLLVVLQGVWRYLSLHKDTKTGLIASAILASNALFALYGKMSLTDAPLLATQVWFAISLERYTATSRLGWAWVAALSLGAGMLVKGPSILIFGGPLYLALLLFGAHGRRLLRPVCIGILALSPLPLLLWGYAAWQQDGGTMVRWMIDWYILNRVGGNVFGQTGPPGYHLVFLLAGFLVFLPLWPHMIARLRNTVRAKNAPERFLLIWLLCAWLPYEFTSSKLPSYALAAHPALAMLLAITLRDISSAVESHSVRTLRIFLGGVLTLAGAAIWLLPIWLDSGVPAIVLPALRPAATILVVIGLYWCFRYGSLSYKPLHIALLAVLFASAAWLAVGQFIRGQFSLMKETALALDGAHSITVDSTIQYYPSLLVYLQWQTDHIPALGSEETFGLMDKKQSRAWISNKPMTSPGNCTGSELNGLNPGRSGDIRFFLYRCPPE